MKSGSRMLPAPLIGLPPNTTTKASGGFHHRRIAIAVQKHSQNSGKFFGPLSLRVLNNFTEIPDRPGGLIVFALGLLSKPRRAFPMTARQQRRLEQKLARKAAKRALKTSGASTPEATTISEAKIAAN